MPSLFSFAVFLIILFSFEDVHCNENKTQSRHCASIFAGKGYKGYKLNVTDGDRWAYRRHLNLIPSSVKVQPQCSLALFDGLGNIQTIHRDVADVLWPGRRPLHLSCCQCGNCETTSGQQESFECARIFQYAKCSVCIGTHLDFKNGEETLDFSTLHNKVSSVAVRKGCNLLATYEVQHSDWKVVLKANLRNGDNFMESQGLFSEEATVRITKAECSCGRSQSLVDAGLHETEVRVEAEKFTESSSASMELLDNNGKEQSQSYEDGIWNVY